MAIVFKYTICIVFCTLLVFCNGTRVRPCRTNNKISNDDPEPEGKTLNYLFGFRPFGYPSYYDDCGPSYAGPQDNPSLATIDGDNSGSSNYNGEEDLVEDNINTNDNNYGNRPSSGNRPQRPALDDNRPQRPSLDPDQRPTSDDYNRPQRPSSDDYNRPQRPSSDDYNRPQRPSSDDYDRPQRPSSGNRPHFEGLLDWFGGNQNWPTRPPRPQRPRPPMHFRPPSWFSDWFGGGGYRPQRPQRPQRPSRPPYDDDIKPVHEPSDNDEDTVTWKPGIVGGPSNEIVGANPDLTNWSTETPPRPTRPSIPGYNRNRNRGNNAYQGGIVGSFVDLLFNRK